MDNFSIDINISTRLMFKLNTKEVEIWSKYKYKTIKFVYGTHLTKHEQKLTIEPHNINSADYDKRYCRAVQN